MEKPSSNRNESSSRLLYTSKEDTEQKERYYDRMTIRGIPVLRDSDIPEDVPVWRGDHTFSSDAASYSLSHFIEPEIAREHPTWSQDQVKAVATARFEQRLSQDLSYEHKESAHEESVVYWQPILNTDGAWELATKYGDTMVTLSELWEHTREYAQFAGNPEAYNPDEHRAQLRMQEELIRGEAKGFVSVLSHPDAIRYVQVWQKTDDGSIISKQVDLYKTTGRDFSHEEGATLIDHLAAYFKEDVGGGEASVISYAHIYIHEKEVAEEDIRTIAIAQVMETNNGLAPSFDRSLPVAVMRIGSVGVRDKTTDSMMQLGAFLREHIDRKIHSFTESVPEGKKLLSDHVYAHTPEDGAVFRDVKKGNVIPLDVLPDIQRSTEYAKAPHMTDVMKTIASEWWIAQTMLVYKDALPVVPVAFILLLTRPLTRESKNVYSVSDAALKYVQEEGITEGQTKMRRLGASIRNVFSFMWKDREKKKVPKDVYKNEGILVGTSNDHVDTRTSDVQQLSSVSTEVPFRVLSISVVVSLLDVLKKLSIRDEAESIGDGSLIHNSKAENEHALVHFTTAIIIWWLTEYSRQTPMQSSDIHIRGSREDLEVSEAWEARTPSFWLLFSIIWYLTAIREQGKHGWSKKKHVTKKTKKQHGTSLTPPLPLSGIIFTFRS